MTKIFQSDSALMNARPVIGSGFASARSTSIRWTAQAFWSSRRKVDFSGKSTMMKKAAMARATVMMPNSRKTDGQ